VRASLVAIGGPSCSGKTTLAAMLADRLGEGKAVMLAQDSFYRDIAHLPLAERERHNFDAPEAVDVEALVSAASCLLQGRPATVPVYDFARHCRIEKTRSLAPAPVVIVEGTLALHWSGIRSAARIRVYVDADAALCLARRIERDVAERGRTRDSVVAQWHATVLPMYDRFVAPSRRHADVIVEQDGLADALGVVCRALSGV